MLSLDNLRSCIKFDQNEKLSLLNLNKEKIITISFDSKRQTEAECANFNLIKAN
jgi:hypothetical protein